jgi:hypothetical protein
MAKVKYIINNEEVKNLKKWCAFKGLSISTFKQAIHRAKQNKSSECRPLGYYVRKLK